MNPLPYVYKITHKTTNQFYIGSRCNKSAKHYSEDLGIKYFTSSNYVKELGFENFKIDWIEEFPTKELAYDWEQMMIHVNLKDPLCLNKSCYFGNKKFNFSGLKHSEETKLKMSKPRTKEHKENISKAQLGSKLTKETKDKISKANKGKIRSLEAKIKMSMAKSGNNHPLFGLKREKKECPYCKKLISINTFNQWHNNNCKLKDF